MSLPPLPAAVQEWLENELGAELRQAARHPIPLVADERRERPPAAPFQLVAFSDTALASARPAWTDRMRRALDRLSLEELLSPVGAYDLTREAIPDGHAIWGPSWSYVGTAETFRPVDDDRAVLLAPADMRAVADPALFWHCFPKEPVAGFGVFEEGRLVSLAGIWPEGPALFDIGVDTLAHAGQAGLGRAVVSAAGRWVLAQGRFIYYTTSPWNPPSARLARSLGLVHAWTEMIALPGPFQMPPQPLGSPARGAEMRNYYPDWAMNRAILPREG